jgi:hypothetical protein
MKVGMESSIKDNKVKGVIVGVNLVIHVISSCLFLSFSIWLDSGGVHHRCVQVSCKAG